MYSTCHKQSHFRESPWITHVSQKYRWQYSVIHTISQHSQRLYDNYSIMNILQRCISVEIVQKVTSESEIIFPLPCHKVTEWWAVPQVWSWFSVTILFGFGVSTMFTCIWEFSNTLTIRVLLIQLICSILCRLLRNATRPLLLWGSDWLEW